MTVAIASGKGGTGKTTLSVNLALYLSEKYKTVLADLDVEEPNGKLFFQGELIEEQIKTRMIPQWIPDKCTFCRICQNSCNYNAVIQTKDKILVFPNLCHSCYACSDLCPENTLPMVPMRMGELKRFKVGNLDFIESRLDIGQEQAVPLIGQTIDYVTEKFADYDFKLFDSPPGTSCPVIEVVKNADFVILVTEPTPFGLNDLRLAINVMEELKKDFAVVVNRYGIGNVDVYRFCEENNIPIIAKIPNDRRIAELYSAGQTLYDKVPQVRKALGDIEKFLVEKAKIKTKNV